MNVACRMKYAKCPRTFDEYCRLVRPCHEQATSGVVSTRATQFRNLDVRTEGLHMHRICAMHKRLYANRVFLKILVDSYVHFCNNSTIVNVFLYFT